MDFDGSVPVQAGLAVLALLGCGHEAGLPLFVVTGAGVLIRAGYAAAYFLGRSLPRDSLSPEADASPSLRCSGRGSPERSGTCSIRAPASANGSP